MLRCFSSIVILWRMKYDVFISYSRCDYMSSTGIPLKNSIVLKIKKLLTENGISFWFDEEGIYSGDAFASKIAKNIKNARIFLFISTEHANKSEWTSKEIAVAHAYKKKIIPFRYDRSLYHESVIIYLADLDFIDYQFNHQKAMQRLVLAIKEYLQNNPETPHTHHTQANKTISEITSVEKPLQDTSSVETTPSTTPPAPKRYGWIKWCVGVFLLFVLGFVGVRHYKQANNQYRVDQNGAKPDHDRTGYNGNDTIVLEDGMSFVMIKVDGGEFDMGGTDEQGRQEYIDSRIKKIQNGDTNVKGTVEDQAKLFTDELPVHEVILSDYYIGETEVTQALWEAVMGSNPSVHIGKNKPVDMVSWNDCQEFISRLNEKTKMTFRLPTEAEWEYAARGGNKSKKYRHSGGNVLDSVGWYVANSDRTTHDVATKQPNELGIYDMNGNVWEWCSDWFDKNSYKYWCKKNPKGAWFGDARVLRGGSWHGELMYCRIANRNSEPPTYNSDNIGTSGDSGNLGFRLAMDP